MQNKFGFTDQAYRFYHPFTDTDRAAIDQRAAALLKEVSWEEQAKAPDNLAQRLHDQAQQQYEREQMQQLSPPR